MGLKFNNEREEENTCIERKSRVKMEANTGVIKPQAKECLERPEAEQDKEVFSARAFRSVALQTP